MKKNIFFILTLFVGSFCYSQQQKSTNSKLLPISIYTATFLSTKNVNSPTYTSVAKNLNFSNYYKFVTVSFDDIDSNRFLISDDNLGTKATIFIYDDYKSYRDENLLKGFLQKYDPTRWDPCNFRQPNIN